MIPSVDNPGIILVVDDESLVLNVVKAYLETAGHTVRTAQDAESGWALFQQDQSTISLLLTDLTMPGANGLDLADRILAVNRELPVLFMSGFGGGADRGYGCVAKPFKASELLSRVQAALCRKPLAGGASCSGQF